MLNLLALSDPLEHVLPHDLFRIGSLHVTNQMLMALVAAILMLVIFPTLFKSATPEAPRGAKNFFEAILEFLRVEVFRPALKEHTDRFVPFLWTVFFFILFCNLLGQIPFGEIMTVVRGGHPSHISATPTGNIATTAALAICAFFAIHINGILQVFRSLRDGTYGQHGHHEEHSSDGGHGHEAAHDLDHMRGDALPADIPADFRATVNPTRHYGDDEHFGPRKIPAGHGEVGEPLHGGGKRVDPATAVLMSVPLYLWNFAPHPFKPAPGDNPLKAVADIGMWAFLLVLELMGALIKPFALMIRLFANMIAGHIVLAVLVGLIPIGLSLLFQLAIGVPVTLMSLLIWVLEIFVAFLQAYIFTFLTTLFIASAVAPEH